MNMTVTYIYSSLAAMADYYDNKALEDREAAKTAKPARKRDLSVRAMTYESFAHVLRNTKIEPRE